MKLSFLQCFILTCWFAFFPWEGGGRDLTPLPQIISNSLDTWNCYANKLTQLFLCSEILLNQFVFPLETYECCRETLVVQQRWALEFDWGCGDITETLGKNPTGSLLYRGSDSQGQVFCPLCEGVFHAGSLSCKADETAATHATGACAVTNLSYSPFQ